MSTLYLGTDVERLASRLAQQLEPSARADFFEPVTVVVPHRPLGQWLRLWLARQQGVAINLRTSFLETALWEMLGQVDPRKLDPAPELLDGDQYRLLVLSVLQENREPGLDFWHNFLQGGGETASRLLGRRLWHLADQLAALIRDYEYHRQDALIQPWLKGELGLDAGRAKLEAAQQAIFAAITRLPDGKRARLNDASGRNFKTLPQYAMEVMEHKLKAPAVPLRTVHLFGLTQISRLHAVTLRWLGRFFDLRFFYLNALAGRLGERPAYIDIVRLARDIRQPLVGQAFQPDADVPESQPGKADLQAAEPIPGQELLHAWGRAGAESMETMAVVCSEPRYFAIERLAGPQRENEALPLFRSAKESTVLVRLQDQFVQGPLRSLTLPARREATLPQDHSLQIVGCPSKIREVETVYQSILANLQRQPSLKQSDIAVLATDMELYRPTLQAVFERPERKIHYNLGDFSAAGVSVFGQALLGMLDLALDACTRLRVFPLLLNPCLLARLGIDRSQALVWLDWVQALDIYQGWNQGDKKERGYADSPVFAWELGLRRLRLGRIMEVGREDGPEPAARFGPVIPFADLHSGDADEVNVFCQAVQGLLPRLGQLRHFQGKAPEWVGRLEGIIRDFLAIPEDRPEEAQVRERLLAGLQKWLIGAHLGEEPQRLSLGLVREMVVSLLEGIEGTRGQHLAGGVTIAALQPLKPMPFRIVYILGLGEDVFPGSNVLSGLDLRSCKIQPGDIRPADFNRYLLLETLLAVKDKIYLLYNNLDIQKDQVLHPSVPLQQLKRYLGQHILDADFVEAQVPLLVSDEAYLKSDTGPSTTDVLNQFGEAERLLALTSAQHDGGLVLSPQQETELADRLKKRRVEFSLADVPVDHADLPPTVTVRNLAKYLEHPVPEALKYHLYLKDEEPDDWADDEPFVSDNFTASGLMRQTLNHVVQRSLQAGVEQVQSEWRPYFEAAYDEWGLRGKVPEEAFGRVDRTSLSQNLAERIDGDRGLLHFLRGRENMTFRGPVLVGESSVPLGARQRFPALVLPLTRPLPRLRQNQVRLVGSTALAWYDEGRFDILTWCFQNIDSERDIYKHILEPVLFWMALRAGVEGQPDSGLWLGERTFTVHVAHADRVSQCTFSPQDWTPELARAYLAELATDFLDPGCLDNLPLRKIMDSRLREAITKPDADLGTLTDDFRDQLTELLDEGFDEIGSFSHRQSALVDLAGAVVPADAFAKVRRRFRPFGCFEMIESGYKKKKG